MASMCAYSVLPSHNAVGYEGFESAAYIYWYCINELDLLTTE